jgi:hypothetical protein
MGEIKGKNIQIIVSQIIGTFFDGIYNVLSVNTP